MCLLRPSECNTGLKRKLTRLNVGLHNTWCSFACCRCGVLVNTHRPFSPFPHVESVCKLRTALCSGVLPTLSRQTFNHPTSLSVPFGGFLMTPKVQFHANDHVSYI